MSKLTGKGSEGGLVGSGQPSLEEWTPDQLQGEAEEVRRRLGRFRTSLARFFVAKQELVDLMLVAAVAQERYGATGFVLSKLTQCTGFSSTRTVRLALTPPG